MKRLFHFMDWPLRAKVVMLLVVAALLPLGIDTFVSIREAQTRMVAETADLLAARGDHLSDQLDVFNRGYQLSVSRVAHLPRILDYYQARPDETERLKLLARQVLKVWPASDANIRGVAILDTTGHVQLATEDALTGQDLSDHQFVRDAFGGLPVISDIYLAGPEVGNAPTIAYLSPVFAVDGKLIGVVAMWVRASALTDVMKASNELAGPGSFAVLFDSLGIRIGHTYSDDMVFHPGGPLDPTIVDALVTENRFGQNTRQLLEDVRAFPEQFDRSRAISPNKAMFRGFAPVNQKWNYGVARRFRTVPWTIFYMVPEEVLNAQMATMTLQKMAFAGIIMLVALIAGALFALVILKPIRSLSSATKLIADGDLSARVPSGHADELGHLASNFNSMAVRIEDQATALHNANDDLERRVEERTAELADKNKDLEIEIAERERLSRLYAALSQINQAIVWARSREELFTKICQVLVDLGGYRLVWIGLLDPDGKRIQRVNHWGGGMDTFSDPMIEMDLRQKSQRPIVTAIREGRSYICNDLASDLHTGAWRETALSAGCRALAVLPIRQDDIVCGAIKVYSDVAGVFQDKEVALLEEAAMDVSFALDNFEREAGRAAAEATLHEERSLLRTLIDMLPDYIYVKDAQSRFLISNEACASLMGAATPADLTGKSDVDFFPAELASTFRAEEKEVLKGTPQIKKEEPFTFPDGTSGWKLTTKLPIRDSSGKITGLVGYGHDITASRQAEEALRESEELYRTLFECAPDGILIRGPEGYYIDANETLCRMLGYTREEFIGLQASNIIMPDDIPRIGKALEAINSKAGYHREWEFRRKDNSHFTGDVIATKMPDGKMMAIVRDISKRKEEEAMRESLAAIVESSDDAIISKDLNSIVTTWNPSAERIFGYTREEMVGDTLFRLFPPDRIDEEASILERIQLGETVKHFETVRIRKDGQPIDISATISPVRDAYGKIIGASKIARNITERKRAHKLLRDSQLRLNSALDAGSIGTWTWDIVNDNLIGDEFIARLFSIEQSSAANGLPASEYLKAVFEEDQQSVADGLAVAIESCGTYDIEYRVRQEDGELLWVQAKGRVEGDAEGNATSFHGAVTDITVRKRAEEDSRQSETRYRTLFDTLIEGFCTIEVIFDDDGKAVDYRFLEMNPAFEKQTGLHNVQGKLMRDIAPDHEEHWFEIYGKVALTGEPVQFENEAKALGRQFDLCAYRVGGPESRKVAVLFNDITERKRRENERRVISEVIQGIVTTPNLDEFLKLVHHSIGQIVYAENCFVMLHDPVSDMNYFEFWADKYDPLPTPRPMGKGFSSYVLRTGKPLLLSDELKKALFEQGEAEQVGTSSPSWVGVPLRTPSRTIGVMVLQHYEDENAYSQSDLEFLSSVGDQIALAIERKWAEEALGRSEIHYRTLFDSVPDGIMIANAGGYYVEANPSVCEMFGYEYDEFVGLHASKIVAEAEISRIGESLDMLKTNSTYNREWTFRRKDNSEFIGDVIVSLLPDSNRIVMIRDITDRKQAAAALRESEELNRDLVENALDIIYTHDLKGNYLSVNQVGEKITGYTREESLKMNLADTVAPEYLETARKMVAEKLAGNEITAYEVEIIAKDGHRVTVEVNTRIIYENGVPVRVQGIARDVTERKQLEDQFRQSQKMESIGVLAGGVAHDFNNLLTAISGYSDITLRKLSKDDPIYSNVTEIKMAGERAAALTTQLLAFSRKQVLTPRVHNLNSVITEIEKMLRRIIKEDVELHTVLAPDLGNINADPGQIEQVIMNLSVNARDAMPTGGRLTIETQNVYLDETFAEEHVDTMPGNYVRLAVTDNGIGMDASVRQHIFDPFFTTKAIGKGTGLGLSTVHGIVKQSGGNITVYSEPGHGTTFKIYLPRVEAPVEVRRWVEVQEDLSGTETILLVEDEEIVRRLACEVLAENGYTVLEAENAKAAITISANHPNEIHLLLTDVIMPGMSGPVMRELLVAARPDMRALFMSGYTDDAISQGGLLDTNTAFIEKPFSPDELSRKVREVLGSGD